MMEIYSEKHYERAERGLKKSYFVDYVLSQMTLQDDLVTMKDKDDIKSKKERKGSKTGTSFSIEDDPFAIKKSNKQKNKKKEKRERVLSDNLFVEEDADVAKPLKKRVKKQ
jgi:hypothetical protein